LDGRNGMQTQAEHLVNPANDALDAANKLYDLGDPGDDDDKKPQRDEAQQHLKEAHGTLRDQIDVVRGGQNEFCDEPRDANSQFKNAMVVAKNSVDANQSQVDQV